MPHLFKTALVALIVSLPSFSAQAVSPGLKAILLGCNPIGFSLAAGNKLAQPNFASGWAVTRATLTPNSVLSPNCDNTAATLVEDTSNNTHVIVEAATGALAAVTYTISVSSRNIPGQQPRRIAMQPEDSVSFTNNAIATFNLSTGAITGVTVNGLWTNPSATMTAQPNGWWRCSLTFTATVVASAELVFLIDNGTTISYTGDGSSGAYLWEVDWR